MFPRIIGLGDYIYGNTFSWWKRTKGKTGERINVRTNIKMMNNIKLQ